MNNNFSISEIFESIIGESSFAGFPALFIRFSGCNLRCAWCDTQYAYEPSYFLSFEELLAKINSSKQKIALFTGGEPLLQVHLQQLMNEIAQRNAKKIVLETNGSVSIENVNPRVHISLDCKPPSSMEHEKCLFSNFSLLKKTDDIKFVVGNRTDYDYCRKIITEYKLISKANLIVQPVYGNLDARTLSEWLLQDALQARLSIQLHKNLGIK